MKKITLDDIVKLMMFGLIIAIFTFTCSGPKVIERKTNQPTKREKQIEARIDSTEKRNTLIQQRIFYTDRSIQEYDSIFQILRIKLDSINALNDCALSSSFKDSIIDHDQEQKKLFRITIAQRDSLIANQRFIITAKDTLLNIKDSILEATLNDLDKKDSKISRLKKQRNGLIVLATIEAVLIGILSK